MNALELAREAAAIVPPVGASRAIAVHDGTAHRAAFLVQGRLRSAPVGPAFTKPRDACRFVDVLNGEPTPRSASQLDLAGERTTPRSRDVVAVPIEAPDDEAMPGTPGIEPATLTDPAHQAVDGASLPSTDPAAGRYPVATVRACAICGRPLPPGSRSHRRTDSDSCRRALARAEAKEGRAADVGVSGDVPLSEAPSTVPTSREVVSGYALLTASRDAGPTDLSGIEREPDDLVLGI